MRELRNLVQRLLILGARATSSWPRSSRARPARWRRGGPARGDADFAIDFGLPLREARDPFERAYLCDNCSSEAGGSVGKLAIMAGMERTHLYRKLRDLGVDIKNERQGGA